MARTKAKAKAKPVIILAKNHSKSDIDALGHVFGSDEMIESLPLKDRVEGLSQQEFLASEHSEPLDDPEADASQHLSALTREYLSTAIHSLCRAPSPMLKAPFRTTLLHWRALMTQALKTNNEPTSLVQCVLAIVGTEGAFEALQLIRNVSGQMLWRLSVDVARDRRSAGDLPDANTFKDGADDHTDPEYVAPPTEDEATDAFFEAHAWLSSVADFLAPTPEDADRLGLESGLEFTSRKIGDDWVRVYDLSQALSIQLAKNLKSMNARDANKILARKDAFLALAALAA